MEKSYTIYMCRSGQYWPRSGTLEELKERFTYVLLKGKAKENKPGNREINQNPETIGQLLKALNDAERNAGNGRMETCYTPTKLN